MILVTTTKGMKKICQNLKTQRKQHFLETVYHKYPFQGNHESGLPEVLGVSKSHHVDPAFCKLE